MEIITVPIGEIKAYNNNPRRNDEAVTAVAESIREFGFKVPIVLDKDNVIIAGHTRLKAAKRLGLTEVPCIVADDLSDEQVKAFRLADNKTAELADWDVEKLLQELDGIINIDMTSFGFELFTGNDEQEEIDEKYSQKINIPQYEITGEDPPFEKMLDESKAKDLIAEIKEAGLDPDEQHFLIEAAKRHNVFNYRAIAEHYAHATPEVQRLMEKSALVIIDLNNAIANGYVTLSAKLTAIADGAEPEEYDYDEEE